jgi:hypothetical protein
MQLITYNDLPGILEVLPKLPDVGLERLLTAVLVEKSRRLRGEQERNGAGGRDERGGIDGR